jgi:hypothetical protein
MRDVLTNLLMAGVAVAVGVLFGLGYKRLGVKPGWPAVVAVLSTVVLLAGARLAFG